MTAGWGAEQLTREELLNLGAKLHRAWDASVRQANRPSTSQRQFAFFALASEMCWLWGEAADELIARREARVQGATAAREPEAGS